MKYVYPAIFTFSKENDSYIVQFVDSENWFTDGESLTKAMENAIDVLNLMLLECEESGDKIPKASKIEKISVDENSFVQYIFADTQLYKKTLELKRQLKSA